MGSQCRRKADTVKFSLAYEPHHCCNSTEKSLDTTAFVASLVLAVEMENNDGVSFLTIGGCFDIPEGNHFIIR